MRLFETLSEELAQKRTTPWRIADASELDGFDPAPGDCHGNARRFADKHDGFVVVGGWFKEAEGRFARHSVVADLRGNLMCVTLGPHCKEVPGEFIVHQIQWSETPYSELGPEALPESLSAEQAGRWQPEGVEPPDEFQVNLGGSTML
jgi:hypothetical protein